MSSYARFYWTKVAFAGWTLAAMLASCLPGYTSGTNIPGIPGSLDAKARVVITHDSEATEAFRPRPDRVSAMVDRGIRQLTGKRSTATAWSSLVSTQDFVGIKVYSSPGLNSGTRTAVVAAVIEGLLEAKVPPRQILVWDKHRADLRRAGYFELGRRYGIRVEGSALAGYDPNQFYETSLLGHLVWGDSEFGGKGEQLGRKSFLSKLVTQGMTKIINITPLLNHNSAGVSGNLYSLTMGSVDNTHRFETHVGRLSEAVPELYALPLLGDRVVLNIVDALLCQYQGEQLSLLHYSIPLNELRFSKDPVALDVLSLSELERQRESSRMFSPTNRLPLYRNASELDLGVSDRSQIRIERAPEAP